MGSAENMVKRGDRYFMIATPAVECRGVKIARIIAPFASRSDADIAAALLNERYPLSKSHVAMSQYTTDHDADQLNFLYCQARGDLAEILADLGKRTIQ